MRLLRVLTQATAWAAVVSVEAQVSSWVLPLLVFCVRPSSCSEDLSKLLLGCLQLLVGLPSTHIR
jgi:hypothetical protein